MTPSTSPPSASSSSPSSPSSAPTSTPAATVAEPPASANTRATTPVLLTARQLAAALGVSRRTLTTWDQRGIIPSLRVGRVRRYELDRVRTALRHYEPPPATTTAP